MVYNKSKLISGRIAIVAASRLEVIRQVILHIAAPQGMPDMQQRLAAPMGWMNRKVRRYDYDRAD